MQWKQIIVTVKQDSGEEDALGNPIYSKVDIDTFNGRFTEYNQTDFSMLGYDTYSDSRKLLIPNFNRELYDNVISFTVEGKVYNVDMYKDLTKYGLFYITRYRK